jgi:AraC-like DNA-binding protein
MLIHFVEILVFSFLLLLGFILLFNPMKVNKKANFWFGMTLLLWASFWIDEIVFLIKGIPFSKAGSNSLVYIQFFTPIFLFVSIIFFTNPNYRWTKKSLGFLIVPLCYLGVLVIEQILQIDVKIVSLLLILGHALAYTLLAYLKIRKHQRSIKSFASDTLAIDLKWLEYIMRTIFTVVLLVSVFNVVYFGLPLNLYMNIAMLIVVLFIAYNILKQKEIFPVTATHRADIIALNKRPPGLSTAKKRKLIEDDALIAYKETLHRFVLKEALYLNADINLATLAASMNLTTHQLSYIINNGFQQNFFQFINGYRVEKAKTLLISARTEKLTILGIAYESGFSSKTAFNTTFKKVTGQTPTQFKNSINKP